MLDLAIVGGGPAGASAAVYARRFEMKTALLFREPGGLISTAHLVENWPGIPSISGFELGEKLLKHARGVGAEEIFAEVSAIEKEAGGTFLLRAAGGKEIRARAVLLASGTFPRKLGVPGEAELLGKGVSYCATCDGPFFKGKRVAVIGGSDSCCNEAEFLADLAEKVFLIYRREELRAEPANRARVEKNPKIEMILSATPRAILGKEKVEGFRFERAGKEEDLKVDGVFVAIGREPMTGLLDGVEVEFSERGEVLVDEKKMTKTPGLFAAGDVVPGIKQAIIAAASGVEAVFGAREWLRKSN